ncbi:MAG TPA: acyltransferase family protein [Acidimicrobiia bacterium]|nr:acyltransferase family protein [Acidimicrobiia bacterium]
MYQPALDGVRAFAVLSVFAYHLDAGWAQGGFLGVDTFFVLSGFLITSLLVGEFARHGGISFAGFWARRARRLLPALLLVLIAVAAYAVLAAPAEQLDRLRGDGLATLFYGANWRFIASGQSYFDLFSEASPLRHMWSLAIEEQFYLVWPLITFACLRLARGRHWLLGLVCGAGAGASIAAMAALYDPVDPSRAYYGTDGRAHLLLIGAGLALVLARWHPARPATRSTVHALGLAGALACVGFWTLVPDTAAWMYRGGYAVFGLCVAAVITSAIQPGRFALRSFLSLAPLVWIGRISYGLYLWHWPVIVVASPARTGLDGASLTILRVGLTFAFATASFYLVEQPIRRGALRGRWAMAISPTAFVATGVVVVIATAGAQPLPTYLRNGPEQLTSRAEQLPKPEAQPAPPPTAALAAPVGAPTAPPPKRIMLVGDSVAESLLDGLRESAAEQGVQVYPASVPGCGVIGGQPIDLNGTPFKWSATCEREVPKYQTARLAQVRPDVVVWLSGWDRDDRVVDGQNVTTTTMTGRFVFARLIDEAASRLTSTGARLVMMTVAPPSPSDSYPDPPKDPKFDYMNRMLRDYARAHTDHTSVVDLARLLCPNGQPCPDSVSGVRPRPRDGNHFEPDTALWVAHQLMPEIMAATPGSGVDVVSDDATTNASVGKRA